MTRKYYCLVKREKSFFGTLICEISPVFRSMGQKRKLWKPGLKKWRSSVFITWNYFKEGETDQAKLDRSKVTQKKAQRNKIAMPNFKVGETDQAKLDRSKVTQIRAQSDQRTPCQVSVVKAQRSKDAMPGFIGLSDQGTPCQVSVEKYRKAKPTK